MIVCSGFRHGLSLVARALAAAGRRALAMEDPCVPQHRAAARARGPRARPLPVDERGARTDLLATARAGAVLSPAHQFPTGVVLHRDRRAAAIAWAAATGGLIVEDDYDGEFRYDRQPVGALQALAPDRVVYGGTASKTLAPGLRLAWMVVPPPRAAAIATSYPSATRSRAANEPTTPPNLAGSASTAAEASAPRRAARPAPRPGPAGRPGRALIHVRRCGEP